MLSTLKITLEYHIAFGLYILSSFVSWLLFRRILRNLQVRLKSYTVRFTPEVEGASLYDACRFETLEGMAVISSLTREPHTTLKDIFWELTVGHLLGPSPSVRRMKKGTTFTIGELVEPHVSFLEYQILLPILWTVKLMHKRSIFIVVFTALGFFASLFLAAVESNRLLSILRTTLWGFFPTGYALAIVGISIKEIKSAQ